MSKTILCIVLETEEEIQKISDALPDRGALVASHSIDKFDDLNIWKNMFMGFAHAFYRGFNTNVVSPVGNKEEK